MTIDLTRNEIDCITKWIPANETDLLRKLRDAMREAGKMTLGQLRSVFDPAWERHHKRNGKVYQVVLQTVLGRIDEIDWEKFNANHPAYCSYWDRRGWTYSTETLIDWIDNGCQPPPPEPVRQEANTRTRRIAERE